LPIPAGIALAAGLSALAGGLLCRLTLRLRGDYLAIVTLGFSELVRLIAANEIWLTNGSDGISGVPGPWRGTLTPFEFNMLFAGLTSVAVLAVWALTERLRRSPWGRALRAIRDDDTAAAVAGKPVARFKIQAFALGAAILGIAGAFYAHYTSYIAPDIFRPLITIYIFLALTAGGTGNSTGAVIGAIAVVAVLEGSRFLEGWVTALGGVQKAALREMVIGVALIAIMQLRPRGLLPETPPGPFLGKDRR
jgi:branched-chain amino acid transport system permease protein